MTKVYVVRYGEYSDQGIAGVFSTKEKAERYCKVQNEIDEGLYYDNFWVSGYTLDKHEVSPNVEIATYYTVCITTITDKFYKAGEIYFEDEERRVLTKPVIIEKYKDYISVSSTKSLEHAKKIAIEQYQICTQQKLEDGEF